MKNKSKLVNFLDYLKNNKKMAIAIVVLIVTIVCSVFDSYAAESTLVQKDLSDYPTFPTSYNGKDFSDYFIRSGTYDGKDVYFLHCYYDTPSAYLTDNDTLSVDKCSFVSYIVNVGGSSWEYYGNYDMSMTYYVSSLLYTSFDIYQNSDMKDVVFPQTPSISVAGLTQNQVTELMTGEIIGLIPLVVGLVVVSLALWKGLALLSRKLRGA